MSKFPAEAKEKMLLKGQLVSGLVFWICTLQFNTVIGRRGARMKMQNHSMDY